MRRPSNVAVLAMLFVAVTAQGQPQRGQPWTGGPGTTRTTAELMAAEARAAKPTKPRIHPEHERPRFERPQNPNSPLRPNVVAKEAVPDSQPLSALPSSTTFVGATLADTQAFPPDSMGAVGPSQFLVVVNGRIRSFNKTTGVADGVINMSMDTFFAAQITPPNAGERSFASDPRVRFDRASGRWIIVMIDAIIDAIGNITRANRVMIAVSSNGVLTPATSWTYYYFQQDQAPPAGDAGDLADYPTLGIDANALYIGVTEFSPTTYVGTSLFVVRKSSILNGGPIVVTAFRNLTGTPNGPGLQCPQGVDSDGSVPDGYVVSPDNASFGTLVIRRITNAATTPVLSDNMFVTVPATMWPSTVPHLGNNTHPMTNGYLDALDDRLYAGVIRKGHLWTAHSIGVDTTGAAVPQNQYSSTHRNAARWYDITNLGTTPTLNQSGNVFDQAATNSLNYWIDTIGVSGQGHAALGFSVAGPLSYIDAAYATRLASDPAGFMSAPVRYTSSTTAYNPASDSGGSGGRRWGDYSFVSVDPEDDMTMWTIQEFCSSTNSYAVQAVKILAPPPAQPSSCNPATLVRGATSDVQLTATSSGGSGLFDPGNGFTKHLAATFSGTGITVNSVTYTDPTHATLNVTVASDAAAGGRTITVTNPDGQQAMSSSAVLTIASNADVAISASASPSPATAGYPLSYHITASNNGPDTATSTVATVTLPANVSLLSMNPGASSQSGTQSTFNIGDFASGASYPIDITVTVPANASGMLTLSGTISSASSDSTTSNNSFSLTTGVQVDSDGDGLPDAWEILHNLDPNDASDASVDADGDGLTSLQEYRAGTDPHDIASALSIRATVSGSDVLVTFPSVAGKTYHVEWTNDLAGGTWQPLGSPITGTGSDIVLTDAGAAANPPRFYHVSVTP